MLEHLNLKCSLGRPNTLDQHRLAVDFLCEEIDRMQRQLDATARGADDGK
jgi:hypothetical protein